MYEYKTIHDIDLRDIEETINNYAKKGWRLIQLLELKETQGFVYTLAAVMEKQKVQVFE